MRTPVLIGLALILGACSSGGEASITSEPPEVSATPATADDFHTDWCVSALAITRAIDDLPTLKPLPDVEDQLNQAVTDLDALSVQLDEAGLSDEAIEVRALTDAVDDLANALGKIPKPANITPASLVDVMADQSHTVGAVAKGAKRSAALMGSC